MTIRIQADGSDMSLSELTARTQQLMRDAGVGSVMG